MTGKSTKTIITYVVLLALTVGLMGVLSIVDYTVFPDKNVFREAELKKKQKKEAASRNTQNDTDNNSNTDQVKEWSNTHDIPQQDLLDVEDDMDACLDLGDEYMILAVGKEGRLDEGGYTDIYEEPDEYSDSIARLQFNCAVEIDTEEYEDEGYKDWIPVKLPNMNCIGYVPREHIVIDAVHVINATDNDTRNTIVEDSVKYIGLKFVRYGKSLEDGIDCSNFANQIYALANVDIPNTPNGMYKKGTIVSADQAKPGDIIYYNVNNGEGHVAIYLGNNFLINSAGHSGKEYPRGGVRICRLQYKDRETYEFCKFID